MILPDFEIERWARNEGVEPFDEGNVNPASIDLRMGDKISTPRWYWNPLTGAVAWYALSKPDPKEKPHLYWNEPAEFGRYTLWPGRFVLAHSMESTAIPKDLAAFLLLKSSKGREGLEHLHAGFGDPGFGIGKESQWTWELTNQAPWPIVLVAGTRLTQLVLMQLKATPHETYEKTGRYQGQRGPTAPRPERLRTDYVEGKVGMIGRE